ALVNSFRSAFLSEVTEGDVLGTTSVAVGTTCVAVGSINVAVGVAIGVAAVHADNTAKAKRDAKRPKFRLMDFVFRKGSIECLQSVRV
ncbi:MAG TPA: hypothetical protein PKM54_11725, partial [Anaerolineales bacterium]|nr:hypothetical protein [Anaerolineales bacterium]